MTSEFKRSFTPVNETHLCEDCGEQAKRQTIDGVWLCDGDYELLCEQYFIDNYVE